MAAGDVHRYEAEHQGLVPHLVTLTYRPADRWYPRHVSEYLRALRRHFGGTVRYVWVAELQAKRMARSGESAEHCLHYHVVVWLPHGVAMPKPDLEGHWPHGMTQVEPARQPIGYLLKYASKGEAGEFPRGARLCGAGGLEREGRLWVRWWLLPRYVREVVTVGDDVHRARGGGWVSLSTGEWWPPWDPPPCQTVSSTQHGHPAS